MSDQMKTTRRTMIRTAAWSTPVIAVVAAAPAYAASEVPGTIVSGPEVTKCPGQSTALPWTYVFTFAVTGTATTVTVTNLTIGSKVFAIRKSVAEYGVVHAVTDQSTNSADATGAGLVTYMVNGETKTFPFTYSGSHPDKNLCKRVAG